MYEGFNREKLIQRKQDIEHKYNNYKQQNLKLDMSRGKPSWDQLNLSNGIYENVDDFISDGGVDSRNYGILDGLLEMRKLFAQIIGVSPDEVIAGDSSSLNMMYDAISRAFNHGIMGNVRIRAARFPF